MAKKPEMAGKYKILDQVGKGGMGVVYTAMHPTLKRKVILKKLTVRDREFRERFRLEADVMMDLRSDYIVDMYDHFREGSSWYIAMEYIDGMTLAELIEKQGALPLPLLFYIMYCAAKALEYIHSRGIIHRDIKPSNIYLSRSGDVKLGDFGIASSSSRDVNITGSEAAMGTPAYMAPEQFRDSSGVGREADIFSFGVTLYEAMTGAKPFLSGSYTELKKEISRGKYRRPAALRPGLPLSLRLLTGHCLMGNRGFRLKNVSRLSVYFYKSLGRKGIQAGREALKNLFHPGKKALTEPAGGRQGENRFPYLKAGIAAAGAVISGILILYYLSGHYGAVRLRVVPYSEPSIYTCYREDGNPQKTGRFSDKGEKKLILPEGNYRIAVESGSSLIIRSFYIFPRKREPEALSLTFLASPSEGFPLNLSVTVRDGITGKDLSQEVSLFLRREGRWVPLTGELKDSLTTGAAYGLLARAAGYADEIYEFTVAHGRTSVSLEIPLGPLGNR